MKQARWFVAAATAMAAVSLARADGPPSPGLVVIAPRAFGPVLARYVSYRQRTVPTRLVALEDLRASGRGVDDPERIKRWLHREWRHGTLRYALLVGDVDILPVRYMALDRITPAAFDYSFYPSDLYYADLARADGSFDDWNARRDGFHGGYYGEVRGEKNKRDPINFDGIDYLPEIAVGRWPVRTAEQAARIAAKTVRYEDGLRTGAKPGRRRAALLAVDGWVDSRPMLEAAAKDLGAAWKVEKRYYDGASFGSPRGPSEADLYALLAEGLGLAIHTGHGDGLRWDGACTAAGLEKVGNADRLPILFSAGCSTAYFAPLAPYGPYVDVFGTEHRGTDAGEVFTAPPPPPSPYQRRHNPTGLGETSLLANDGGAVAYIGCNTGSQPCGLTLAAGFARAIGKGEKRLGDAWVAAVRHYHAAERLAELKPNDDWYPPSIFFQARKFMLFGDPALSLPAR